LIQIKDAARATTKLDDEHGSLATAQAVAAKVRQRAMSKINELSGVLDSAPMGDCSALYESLRSHYLFAGLDAADFEQLAKHIAATSLEKGEVLFHRGDAAEHFYFIDTGLIELSLIAPTGDKKTLEVIGPGRTFGEAVAFMQGHKYPVSAEALQDSRLCRIPNKTYVELIRSNSDASMRLLADISRHLHDRVREIEHLTIQNARTRLTSYLVDHLVEPPVDDQATARLDLPRHVIASRLSIQPETLSRLLRNLTDEGIVSVDDRVVFIHSVSRLRPYD
jgi:CRP/FNR family transcriptional regulator, dissimilatory nitrate respiration regulator